MTKEAIDRWHSIAERLKDADREAVHDAANLINGLVLTVESLTEERDDARREAATFDVCIKCDTAFS